MLVHEDYISCYNPKGFHRIVYTDWNPHATGRPIVCVHGLTGRGSDFDRVAVALALKGRRVICVDMAGRGRSDWLPNGDDYGYPQYLADLACLLARIDPANRGVDWIGVSMGGLLGIRIAALKNQPIHRMVINDIGPYVPESGLEPIYQYIQLDYRFLNLDEMAEYIRSFRPDVKLLSPTEFQRMLGTCCRKNPDGTWTFAFDPGIVPRFLREPIGEIENYWPLWDQITCPVLVLRGADSSLLLPETAEEMQQRGPCADMIEYEGYGHVPSMYPENQVNDIVTWLLATS